MKSVDSLLSSFRTLLTILFVLSAILLMLPSSTRAQIINTSDTLKVISASGNRGDSARVVSIYLRNIEAIAGFQLRVVYDPTYLEPNSQQFVNPTPSHRAYPFYNPDNGAIYAADISVPGEVTFVAVRLFTPVQIDPGAGSIVDLLFNVKGTAPDGNTLIQLANSQDSIKINALTDLSGNLILPVLRDGTFTVGTGGGGPGNNAPTIASISNQQVMEGDLLTFQVTATDPDGDPLTLSAQNLPPNANFPTVQGTGSVTGTFTFTPSLTQGPATYTVTFTARDDSNATGQRNVSIEVLNRPENILRVDSLSGGIPGKTPVLVPLVLSSIQNMYGFQFDLAYNDSLINIDSFVPVGNLSNFDIYTNLGDSSGFLTLVSFSLSGDSLPIAEDTVLLMAVSIDSLAPFGPTLFNLKNGRASTSRNPLDPSSPLTTTGGKFTVDQFGDINLHDSVNVQDAVIMVSYLLGQATLNQRQLDAADVNRDASIDIGDLVGIINLILGRPINAPTYYVSGLATVELAYDQLQPGALQDIDLQADFQIPVAGVQVAIDYDTGQLKIIGLEKTVRTTQMTLQHREVLKTSVGRTTLLMYSPGGKSIQTGEGSILTLKAQVSPNLKPEDKVFLKISKLVLADTGAVVIPTGGGPIVPTDFKLEQNFPNPFNAQTTIRFEVPFSQGNGAVRTVLKVYNILGRKVKTLVDEPRQPGRYQIIWDGRDDSGSKVSSGMYFYRLKVGSHSESKKMTLLK